MNREKLLKTLNALEGSSTFKGRMALYEAMGRMLKISSSKVQALIKEFSLESAIKTPKAKLAGSKQPVEVVANASWEKQLKAAFPKHQSLVKNIIGGSRAAAVKLMCLDCSGHIRAEITNCPILSCPLYNFRPYQNGKNEEDEENEEREGGKTESNGGGQSDILDELAKLSEEIGGKHE